MAKTTYAVRASVRVRGVTYRNPTDAFVAADELEHDAQERADAYRRNGDEGLADKTIDRGRGDAETLRTWARQREEYEARGVEQPPNRPTRPSPKKASPSRKAARKPAPRRDTARGAGPFGGRSGSLARRGYARSGAQAQVRSAGLLGWQIAGATIFVALLTLFLTKRGSQAFADLTSAAAIGLRLIVDPVDPLKPHLLDTYVAQAQAAATPATRPLTRAQARAFTRAPANRRTSTRQGAQA